MSVRIKFCGLTQASDAAFAESLGASYVGVVFAGGPRLQSVGSARDVFGMLRGLQAPQRVGVWGAIGNTELLQRTIAEVRLDIVQLHADPSVGDVATARELGAREVWAVVRIDHNPVSWPRLAELFNSADAVVLDTKSTSTSSLGGSGERFDWRRVADQIAPFRGDTKVIVAGGLNPDNVADAIRILDPYAVDVSSGVECAPGVKDFQLMQRFADAVREASGTHA